MLVVFAGWWGGRWSTQALKSPASSIAITQPERRVLADGTVVEYPSGTELAVDFSSPLLRRVTLRKGEAHFEVASNPARPFVVNAAGVDFRAVGTAFSVQVGTAAVEVLVTEGRVAVEDSSTVANSSPAVEEPASSAPALVSAGHRLSVAIAVQPRQVALVPESCSAAEIERRLAWRSPRIEFSDVPLRDVVAAINGFSAERGGAQFTLADPALGGTRMSGIFRVDDAQAFIGILESGFGISAERREGQSIVLRKGP
jgi:transmembrane sensor